MELPLEVLIHNELLSIKGGRGTLLQVSNAGHYEVNCHFGQKIHRVLFPIATTVLIARDPEPEPEDDLEIER